MTNPRRQEVCDDHGDRTDVEDFDDSSTIEAMSSGVGTSGIGSSEIGGVSDGNGREIGLTERLTNIFAEDGDGDLLLQQSDRGNRVLQWLQALDVHVMGACRADERLKPFLKLNASSGLAEDCLLAHLSQHFEPLEVGMLARCFCIPLVSIRVGKINKQGTRLCPTTIRGNLNLTLLPTSDLRLSFIGDDGEIEHLLTLNSKLQCSAVSIEEIEADSSGRSFLIKISDSRILYFWCSEKSHLLGIELLSKMKDLIKKKPSIAELTGISESRLGCFATHLRAYVVGSQVSNNQTTSGRPSTPSSETTPDVGDTTHSTMYSASAKSLRPRHVSGQAVKANSVYQGSLSPRSSSFKEGLPRNLSSLRSATREKLRRRGDGSLSAIDNLTIASSVTPDVCTPSYTENNKLPEIPKSCMFSSSSFLESLGKFTIPPTLSPHVPSVDSPLFSPYYCLCPTGSSTLQYSAGPPQLPISSIEFTLPPFPSLLPATRSSSLLTTAPPFDLPNISSAEFPAFLPDPLVRLPMPTSQQFPTFTPLMCDPIVHIPVIDICYSGQGYLVSGGPAISTTVPPLHPTHVNPLISKTESMVEKSARETLRMLISGSTQSSAQLLDVFPGVLTTANEQQGLFVAGNLRGLYGGIRDVDAIANSVAAMGLVMPAGRLIGSSTAKRCGSSSNLETELQAPSYSVQSCSDDEDTDASNLRKETTDL